jgi:hypothetical protein
MSDKPQIALGMPRYGEAICAGAARSFYVFAASARHSTVRLIEANSSLINHCFNHLWCTALNERERGITHFAMIHSDIEPSHYWLDTLLLEMQKVGADVISAVVPVKDDRGITSTAVDTGNLFHAKRLTMKEVMSLPETFTEEDAGGPLLLNTGLWLCDMRGSWAEDICFRSHHQLAKRDGQWFPEVISEDWDASDQFNKLGLKLAATRKVKVKHHGASEYPNDQAWGRWSVDEAWTEHQKKEDALCVSSS